MNHWGGGLIGSRLGSHQLRSRRIPIAKLPLCVPVRSLNTTTLHFPRLRADAETCMEVRVGVSVKVRERVTNRGSHQRKLGTSFSYCSKAAAVKYTRALPNTFETAALAEQPDARMVRTWCSKASDFGYPSRCSHFENSS